MTAPACGTRSRYVARQCRCTDCRAANADDARERREKAGMNHPGEERRERAAAVAAHLAALAESGMGTRRIAALAGISRTTVRTVVTRGGQCSAAVARALLAVRAGRVADGVRMNTSETGDALAALGERGWTRSEIARAAGISRLPRREATTAGAVRRIAAVARAAGVGR